MRKLILFFLPLLCFAQSSNYPSALDTNASLFVTADNQQSYLIAAMGTGDSVAVVASGTGFAVSQIVTICDTQLTSGPMSGKCTAWEHMLVTAVNSNQLTVTRGVNGTSPRTHLVNKPVSVLIDAAHQTVLKSAVIAIETALGPNLSNISSFPAKVSSAYNFTAQTPGGSLNVGANTITLSPMPSGITADSVGVSKLYIFSGTGTAEAVPIIGWSATTVTVTCANTHSGSWQIKSASSGIQEAIIAAGSLGSVYIPAGDWPVYGTITVPAAQQVSVHGAGLTATALQAQFGSGDVLYYDAHTYAFVDVADMRFDPSVSRLSGYELHVLGATFGTVRDLYARNTLNGFQFENCNSIKVARLSIQNFTGKAFYLFANSAASGPSTSGGDFSSLWASGSGTHALHVKASTGYAFAGQHFSNCDFQNATNLIYLEPNGGALNEGSFDGLILDSYTTRGIYMVGGSGTGNGWTISNVRTGTSSTAGFFWRADKNWSNIVASNITGGGSGMGIVMAGAKNVTVNGAHIVGDGSGGAENVALTLTDDGGTPVTAFMSSSSTFGYAEDGSTGGGVSTVGVSISAAAHTAVFAGVRAHGSTSAVADLGTLKTPYIGLLVSGGAIPYSTPQNYIATESGSNNAIAGTLTGAVLQNGLTVRVKLAHTLQAGANTFNLNGGGAVDIKSHLNPANNIGTAYAATGTVTLLYDATGPYWLDLSQ